MSYEEFYKKFIESLSTNNPPTGLSSELLALWHDHQNNCEEAHKVAQENEGTICDLVHAYLHRKEGDNVNARYWYRQAGRKFARVSLQDEWQALVKEFCL